MEKRQEESLIWLDWAKELQFIAQAGLTYSKDPFDLERFQRIREISAEIVSRQTGLSFERVTDLFCGETGFQTPKLDTRAAIFQDGKILLVEERDGTWSYNPQNEMFQRFKTKCSFLQNEAYLCKSFFLP